MHLLLAFGASQLPQRWVVPSSLPLALALALPLPLAWTFLVGLPSPPPPPPPRPTSSGWGGWYALGSYS